MARTNESQRIEIELLSDGVGSDAAHDVSFGTRRRPSRSVNADRRRPSSTIDGGGADAGRRWWRDPRLIGPAACVVGLVVVAVLATRRPGVDPGVASGQRSSLPTQTALPTLEPAVTEAPPEETDGPGEFPPPTEAPTPTDPPETTTTFPLGSSLTGGAPVIAVDEPWGIFVSGSIGVYRIDLQTGRLDLIDDVRGAIGGVFPTTAGPVAVPIGNAQGIVPGPPGSYWRIDNGGQVVLTDAATKDVIRPISMPWGPNASYLVGSTASGDPIVYGPDGALWVVNSDDTVTSIGRGNTLSIQPGGGLWVRCDDSGQNCGIRAESAAGSQPVESDLVWLSSFSPDGTWLIYQDRSPDGSAMATRILDLRTGDQVDLDFAVSSSGAGIYGAQSIGTWTPDSRYFIAGALESVAIFDTATGQTVSISLPVPGALFAPLAVF